MHKLYITNEIFGALAVNSFSDEDARDFASSPRDFISAKTKYNLSPDMDVIAVSNKADEINIALPYYSKMDEALMQKLSDENMDNVSGGEIVFVALGLAIGVTGTLSAAGAIATGVLVGAEFERQEHEKRTGEDIGYVEYLSK